MFELFDPKQELHIREGSLPHWYQPGVTYFITFRTDDSVPQSLAKTWHRERDQWLHNHGLDPAQPTWKQQLAANPEWDQQYYSRFTCRFMNYLDRGMGTCPLRCPSIAEVVGKSLEHFHGERYVLGDYVVMPNHVHLLVCLLGDTALDALCYSWKKFTAGQINRSLNRNGRFWQEESFDHMVRSPEQFEYYERYIAQNPENTGLSKGEFLHRKMPP